MAPGVPLRELCAGQVKELRATLLQLGAKLDGRQARVSAAAGGGSGGGGEEAEAEHGRLLAALDAFESGRGLGRRRLWLDLKDPDNCFAFVLLRRALRIVGLNYKLRGSFYVRGVACCPQRSARPAARGRSRNGGVSRGSSPCLALLCFALLCFAMLCFALLRRWASSRSRSSSCCSC